MPITKKTLDEYMRELRRIEEHRTAGAEKKIRRIYKALMKDLNSFLANEYAQFADGDGKLTVAILQEKSRYARFLEEVEKQIDDISPKYSALIRKTVEDTYRACYEGMVEAVETASNTEELAEALQGLSVRPEVMKRAVENPINGLTLPDFLEKHRAEVIYSIKQTINIGLINGDRYDTMAKNLSNRLDINYRKAVNIARTETHRVQEGGFMDCAIDISKGLEGSGLIYAATWRTMKDERVRPQVAPYKRKAGVTPRKQFTAGRRSYIGKGYANHVKMEGVTVKVGDKFDLGNGVKTLSPSNSGDASNDCNCRCFLEYSLMTPEEFAKATKKNVSDVIKSVNKKSPYRQLMNENGITDLHLERTTDGQRFNDAIEAAKKANPHGGSVDTHPIDELKDFKLFLASNNMAGVAVKPDGDITAVFKNADWKQRGAVNDLIITARANGGIKMDCYGRGLVNMYERCGYTPVARVKFNAEYCDDPLLLKEKPDVFVLMKNNDDLETVIKKNVAKAYKLSTEEDLAKLKTFDKDGYEEALKYRDELLTKLTKK